MPLHYTEYIDQNLKEIKDAQLLAEQQKALGGSEFDPQYRLQRPDA